MREITTEQILGELAKPLETPQSTLTGELLGDRLGILKDHTKPEWILFYRKLRELIENDLVAFRFEPDKTEFDKCKNYDEKSYYMSCIQNRGIRITHKGETWLRDAKGQNRVSDINNEVRRIREESQEGSKKQDKLNKINLTIGILALIIAIIAIILQYLKI